MVVEVKAFINSFWHKEEKLPIASINGLETRLQEIESSPGGGEQITLYDPAKTYTTTTLTLVIYSNDQSDDENFHLPGLFLLVANAAEGDSPEAEPDKWVRLSNYVSQGETYYQT